MIITLESLDLLTADVPSVNVKVTEGNVSIIVNLLITKHAASRLTRAMAAVKQMADSLEPGPATHELLSTRHGDLEMCWNREACKAGRERALGRIIAEGLSEL